MIDKKIIFRMILIWVLTKKKVFEKKLKQPSLS